MLVAFSNLQIQSHSSFWIQDSIHNSPLHPHSISFSTHIQETACRLYRIPVFSPRLFVLHSTHHRFSDSIRTTIDSLSSNKSNFISTKKTQTKQIIYNHIKMAIPNRQPSVLSSRIYNTFFRRASVFTATIFAGAFAFELLFDSVTDGAWDAVNRGRQWKDIRGKYVEQQ